MSDMFFGHLEGVVAQVEDDGSAVDLQVLAKNGKVCHASDIHRKLAGITVGTKILLEEANVMLDNGEIVYLVDEDLRGVSVGDECDPPRPQIPSGFKSDLR